MKRFLISIMNRFRVQQQRKTSNQQESDQINHWTYMITINMLLFETVQISFIKNFEF